MILDFMHSSTSDSFLLSCGGGGVFYAFPSIDSILCCVINATTICNQTYRVVGAAVNHLGCVDSMVWERFFLPKATFTARPRHHTSHQDGPGISSSKDSYDMHNGGEKSTSGFVWKSIGQVSSLGVEGR